jgi:uncharacterized protein (TIGR03118 family)
MLNPRKQQRNPLWMVLTLAIAAALVVLPAQAQKYTRTDLITDAKDPNLINAWGLSRSSSSFWWVSDNSTGLATLYDGAGVTQSLVVTIPSTSGQGTSAPTGQVFNYTAGFEVAAGEPSVFIFVGEDGGISGWNPQVDGTHSIIKVNRANIAIYKGVALEQTPTGPQLYATNFKTGQVEIYDSKFKPVIIRDPNKSFRIPGLDQNWAPFGIQSVGGNLVVTFAHRLPGQNDEDHGPGLGWVGVFDINGNLLSVLEHSDFINAPWGIAMTPGDFGVFSHRLLIGNFGDGWIHAYNPFTGKHEGYLRDGNGAPIAIDGLWGLSFGSGTANGKSGSAIELYFTAGPNDENNGLFGKLVPVAAELRGSND